MAVASQSTAYNLRLSKALLSPGRYCTPTHILPMVRKEKECTSFSIPLTFPLFNHSRFLCTCRCVLFFLKLSLLFSSLRIISFQGRNQMMNHSFYSISHRLPMSKTTTHSLEIKDQFSDRHWLRQLNQILPLMWTLFYCNRMYCPSFSSFSSLSLFSLSFFLHITKKFSQ